MRKRRGGSGRRRNSRSRSRRRSIERKVDRKRKRRSGRRTEEGMGGGRGADTEGSSEWSCGNKFEINSQLHAIEINAFAIAKSEILYIHVNFQKNYNLYRSLIGNHVFMRQV